MKYALLIWTGQCGWLRLWSALPFNYSYSQRCYCASVWFNALNLFHSRLEICGSSKFSMFNLYWSNNEICKDFNCRDQVKGVLILRLPGDVTPVDLRTRFRSKIRPVHHWVYNLKPFCSLFRTDHFDKSNALKSIKNHLPSEGKEMFLLWQQNKADAGEQSWTDFKLAMYVFTICAIVLPPTII